MIKKKKKKKKLYLCSVLWLLDIANVPRSLIPVTLMMQVIHFSETSVPTRATWSNFLENDTLHSHRHENHE
jgi:hypothetical protein